MVATLRLLVHQVRSVVEAAAQVLSGRLHAGFVILLPDVGTARPVGVRGGQPLVVRQAHRVSRVGSCKPLQVLMVHHFLHFSVGRPLVHPIRIRMHERVGR